MKVQHQGSLLMITARGTRSEIIEKIQAKNPLFMEVLPLTLEEIFISETEVAGYEIKKFILADHEGVIKRHDVDPGFCDHWISSGISSGRADHAGKLVWNGIYHQGDQCTLCKSVAGWIYDHRTCSCSSCSIV